MRFLLLGLLFGAAVACGSGQDANSTHIFHYRLGDGGELVSQSARTVVESFEVSDTYPVNASRSLLAFPVHCPVGFCVGGAGVSFVNMQTAAVYPRLPASDLGLKPSFVLFL